MSYDRQMKQVQEVGIWWFLTRTGDSAFLWGSPQVLFQRFQQPTVPARGESLYDSDSEGEITKSSPLRLKSTHSSLDFLSPWFVDFPMGWSFDPTCVELPGKTFFLEPPATRFGFWVKHLVFEVVCFQEMLRCEDRIRRTPLGTSTGKDGGRGGQRSGAPWANARATRSWGRGARDPRWAEASSEIGRPGQWGLGGSGCYEHTKS